MQDELLNAAILMRRGSWVDPELFERAAGEIECLSGRVDELEAELLRIQPLVGEVDYAIIEKLFEPEAE